MIDTSCNLLYVMGDQEEAVNDRILMGLLHLGWEIGRNLFVVPDKCHFHYSYTLPLIHVDIRRLKMKLEDGFFNFALVGNVNQSTHLSSAYNYLFESFKEIPVAHVVEQPVREPVWDYVPIHIAVTFYEKKYHDLHGYPINYGLLPYEIPETFSEVERPIDVFFAGRGDDIRNEYVRKLREMGYRMVFGDKVEFAHEHYLKLLRYSLIAPIFPTIQPILARTVETPGQGVCTLMWDFRGEVEMWRCFEEGNQVVFFKDWDDFVIKLHELESDIPKAMAIAQRGYEFVRENHMVYHGTRYVLDTLEALSHG